MTKLEFEELQHKFQTSGRTLKAFLAEEGVAYSTYNYWSKKTSGCSRCCYILKLQRVLQLMLTQHLVNCERNLNKLYGNLVILS